jgi:hypothetical protein
MRPLAVELLLGQIHRPATASAGRTLSDSSLLRLAVRFAPLALVGGACHGGGLLRRLGGASGMGSFWGALLRKLLRYGAVAGPEFFLSRKYQRWDLLQDRREIWNWKWKA